MILASVRGDETITSIAWNEAIALEPLRPEQRFVEQLAAEPAGNSLNAAVRWDIRKRRCAQDPDLAEVVSDWVDEGAVRLGQ